MKKAKNLDAWDHKLVKLSIVALVLLVMNLWVVARNWVASIHWGWFLGAIVILMIRPMMKWCKK